MKLWNSEFSIMSLALCSVSALAQTSLQQQPVRKPGAVVVQVEPLAQPRSLLDLIRMSGLIVDGTVSSVLTPVNGSPNQRTPTIETDSVIAVNAVFAGAVPRNSAYIVIEQVGGKVDQWDVTAAGDPLVAPGERYFLFLNPDNRKDLPNSSGMPRYAVTGVWSGKAKVANAVVTFLTAAHPQLHTYDGIPVDAFIQIVKETISHPYTNTQLPIQPPVQKQR